MTFRVLPRRYVAKTSPTPSRLTAQEQRIANAFRDAVNALRLGVTPDAIAQAIRTGQIEPPMGAFISALGPYVDELQAAQIREGRLHAPTLSNGVGALLRFDVRDPRALAWAQERGAELVRNLTGEQRDLLRRVLANGIGEGLTVDELSDQIQNTIGLHDRWAKAVEKAQASTYERLIGEGLPHAKAWEQAAQFGARYHDRLLRARARNVARTEVMTASNQGRYLSWVQAADQGLINTSTSKKEWVTGSLNPRPGRTQVCDRCAPLAGKQVAWNEEFPDVGVQMPPAHPSCRCTAVLVPVPIDEIRQMLQYSDEEYAAADGLLDTAVRVEPGLTAEITALADEFGGEMKGLEYRLKGRGSLTRKISADAKEAGISPAEAAAGIKDAVRYTIVLPESAYSEGAEAVITRLRERSTEVRAKVRWRKPDDYHGINLQVRDKSGQWYEVQLHTPASISHKEDVIHPLYERARVLPKGAERDRIVKEMIEATDLVPVPQGIDRVYDLFPSVKPPAPQVKGPFDFAARRVLPEDPALIERLGNLPRGAFDIDRLMREDPGVREWVEKQLTPLWGGKTAGESAREQASRIIEMLRDAKQSLDSNPERMARWIELLSNKIERSEVGVNITRENLLQVLRDGRFKSQFETKSSGGLLSPNRRRTSEARTQGIKTTTKAVDRPIYGTLAEDLDDVEALWGWYGDTRVVLRRDVRSRVTWTSRDSLDDRALAGTVDGGVQWWHPFRTHWNPNQSWDLYIEAQIHGGVAVADIAQVQISTMSGWSDAVEELIAECGKRGIDVTYVVQTPGTRTFTLETTRPSWFSRGNVPPR